MITCSDFVFHVTIVFLVLKNDFITDMMSKTISGCISIPAETSILCMQYNCTIKRVCGVINSDITIGIFRNIIK